MNDFDSLNTTSEVLDVATARDRLAHVKPIVGQIMGLSREIASLQAELKTGQMDDERQERLVERHDGCQSSLIAKIRDLNAQGAVLKDPMSGLIDFYTWHEGELVFLCWKHGEDTIDYWHGIEDGFAGRRPVSDLRG